MGYTDKIFDFQAYVQRREANPLRKPMHIQNYAFIEDIEHQREIAQGGLLQQAVSLGLQAWQFAEGHRLKAKSRDIGKVRGDERMAKAWAETCCTFEHQALSLKIIPSQKTIFEAYGNRDGVFFGLSPAGSTLPTNALKFLYGRGIGALDNGHVPYLTLSRFIDQSTRGLWDFAMQIPDSIIHWRRSGDITEDRAGILACHDLSVAILGIMRTELDWDNAEIMREIRRYYEGKDVDWGTPEIEQRVRALKIFMKSGIYLGSGGISISDADEQVRNMLR